MCLISVSLAPFFKCGSTSKQMNCNSTGASSLMCLKMRGPARLGEEGRRIDCTVDSTVSRASHPEPLASETAVATAGARDLALEASPRVSEFLEAFDVWEVPLEELEGDACIEAVTSETEEAKRAQSSVGSSGSGF